MDTSNLPSSIVAPVATCLQELADWAAQHRDGSLAAIEAEVTTRVRALAPRLIEGLIAATQRSLDARLTRDHPRCPGCGALGAYHDWRPRQVTTTWGPVRWERPWARCATCDPGWSPTDQTLGLEGQQRRSAALEEVTVLLGGTLPFREASRLLERLTGVHVGAETMRGHTEARGAQLDAAQQADALTAATTRQATGVIDPAPDQLVAEIDGVMVRFDDGWHEVKLGVIGGWDPTQPPKDRHLRAQSYVAGQESAADFGRRWGAEIARRGGWEAVAHDGPVTGRGVATLRSVVVLADGARWIWNVAAEQCGERVEIVDWYHATEHLGAVARVLFGEGTAAGKAWLEAQKTVLWERGAAGLLPELKPLQASTLEGQAKIATEYGYFQHNQERMRYDVFRAQGLPIGSGAVESSAKYLVQLRMKRPGSRWSHAGGQAVVVLRAHQLTALAKAA